MRSTEAHDAFLNDALRVLSAGSKHVVDKNILMPIYLLPEFSLFVVCESAGENICPVGDVSLGGCFECPCDCAQMVPAVSPRVRTEKYIDFLYYP